MKNKVFSFLAKTILTASIVLLVACGGMQLLTNQQQTVTAATQNASGSLGNVSTNDPAHAVCPGKSPRVMACYDEKTGWNDWQKDGTWFITKDNYLGNTGKG